MFISHLSAFFCISFSSFEYRALYRVYSVCLRLPTIHSTKLIYSLLITLRVRCTCLPNVLFAYRITGNSIVNICNLNHLFVSRLPSSCVLYFSSSNEEELVLFNEIWFYCLIGHRTHLISLHNFNKLLI